MLFCFCWSNNFLHYALAVSSVSICTTVNTRRYFSVSPIHEAALCNAWGVDICNKQLKVLDVSLSSTRTALPFSQRFFVLRTGTWVLLKRLVGQKVEPRSMLYLERWDKTCSNLIVSFNQSLSNSFHCPQSGSTWWTGVLCRTGGHCILEIEGHVEVWPGTWWYNLNFFGSGISCPSLLMCAVARTSTNKTRTLFQSFLSFPPHDCEKTRAETIHTQHTRSIFELIVLAGNHFEATEEGHRESSGFHAETK